MDRVLQNKAIESLALAMSAHTLVWSWPADGSTWLDVRKSILIPAEAQTAINSSPLHQRAEIKRFIDRSPLALEQILALLSIAEEVVDNGVLSVGEVRLSTNLDDMQILSLFMRIRLPRDEFEVVKANIREAYHAEFSDDCQLVTPMILRLVE